MFGGTYLLATSASVTAHCSTKGSSYGGPTTMYRNKLPIRQSTSLLVTQAAFERGVMNNRLQNKMEQSHKHFCHLHVKSLD